MILKPSRRQDEFLLVLFLLLPLFYSLLFVPLVWIGGGWSHNLGLIQNVVRAIGIVLHSTITALSFVDPASILNVAGVYAWSDLFAKNMQIIVNIVAPGALTLAFLCAMYITRPPAPIKINSGRRITTDPKKIEQELNVAGGGDKPNGIFLHPKLRISKKLEAQHFILLGQSGSGKSSVLRKLMLQAMDRNGARTLIFDYKGDFTADTPDEVALLSPWDARSWAWDIALDCRDPSDAQTLSEGLIPDAGDNPFWANGAREILTGIIVHQQKTRGTDWNFKHLADAITAPLDDIQAIIKESYPRAIKYLLDDSDTTQSLEATLSSFSGPIFNLADAFGRHPPDKRISMSAWLINPPAHYPKTIILGGNLNYTPLMKGLIQAIFRVIQSTVGSPAMGTNDNSVFIFLDEFLQLGRLDMLMPLLEVARGKGVRLFLAGQDQARINDVYSRDTAHAMMGTLATKIFFKSSGPSTQDYADLIGYQDAKEFGLTNNLSPNQGGGGQAHSWNTVRIPAFDAPNFGTKLGVLKDGVRALVFTGGEQVGLLDFPFCTKNDWKEGQREGLVRADWLSANFPHSEDEFQLMLADRRAAEAVEQFSKSARNGGSGPALAHAKPIVIEESQAKPRPDQLAQVAKNSVYQHPIFSEQGHDIVDKICLANDANELSNNAAEVSEALDMGHLSDAIIPGMSMVGKAIEIIDGLGSDAKQTGTLTVIEQRQIDDELKRKRKLKIK